MKNFDLETLRIIYEGVHRDNKPIFERFIKEANGIVLGKSRG
jgi:hypothetical protein